MSLRLALRDSLSQEISMRRMMPAAAMLLLSACTTAQDQQALSAARTFCEIRTVAGPVVKQLILATDPNAAAAAAEADVLVGQTCAAVGALPASTSSP
ncbi:MAG: hypothetical protein ACHQIO_20360 [Nevskiales bacterium]